GVLSLTSPPSSPCVSRNAFSTTNHSCSRIPPIPSGSFSLWLGPATKPSSDIVRFAFNLPIDSSRSGRRVLGENLRERDTPARGLRLLTSVAGADPAEREAC